MRTLSKITLVLGISLVLATGCSSDDSSDDSTLLWLAALSQVPASACTASNLVTVSGSAQALTLAANAVAGAGAFSGHVSAAGLTGANTIRFASTTTTLNTSGPFFSVSAFRGTSCADQTSANQALTALSCTKAANQINCTVNTAGDYLVILGMTSGSGAAASTGPTDITVQKL